MPNLTILRGLQGSGKTRRAEAIVKASKGKTKRVERDCLREMLHFELYNPKHEKIVTEVQDLVISFLLDNGFDVVSSDTNLNPAYVTRLRKLAAGYGALATTDNTLMGVPLEACIERDLQRPRSVGERVIRQTYHRYRAQFPDADEQAIYNDPTLPIALVSDLDGTLADISHRNPYDASTCLDDAPRAEVITMFLALRDRLFMQDGVHPFIFSGRSDKYYGESRAWLERYLPIGFNLVMRKDGDNRPDEVVKREMIEEHIRGKYRVYAWFDDRPKVIRMLRGLGVNVIDVGEGVEF